MALLRVPARMSQYYTVENFVLNLLPEGSHDADDVLAFRLAAEEIFTNIVSYAYGPDGGEFEVVCEHADDSFMTVKFMDKGKPFNPLETPIPDITAPVEEREPGGLGVYLATQFMDDITYKYENGSNILTMKKRLGANQ